MKPLGMALGLRAPVWRDAVRDALARVGIPVFSRSF
jgi:hypothetical protein